MTDYNYNTGLSGFEKANKCMFSTPRGSLCRWGVDKIDHYYKNEIVNINYWKSFTVRRIISCAIPLFALLDTIRFAGEALFRFVTLHPKDTLYVIAHCAKSMQLFISTVLAIPLAQASPQYVYKSDRMWNERQKDNLIGFLKDKLKKANDKDPKSEKSNLRDVLLEVTKNAVHREASKQTFDQIVDMIVDEYPEKQSYSEVVSDSYIEFFSNMIVSASSKNIKINPENRDLQTLIQEIVKLRAPEFRLKLIGEVFESIESNPQYFEGLNELKNYSHVIPYYLLKHLTKDSEVIKCFSDIFESRPMKDNTRIKKLINNLFDIVNLDIKGDDKERMLKHFIAAYKQDEEEKNINGQIGNLNRRLGREKRKLKRSKKNEKLKAEIQKKVDELVKSKNELEKKIKTTGKTSHLDNAMKNLSIILFLDSEYVVNILNELDKGEQYSLLSDKKMITSLYTKLFDLDEEQEAKLDEVLKLRAPWALIKFHLRLLEYPGKTHDEVLKTEKEIFLSILEGNIQNLRFNTENNPHLETVFAYREELKGQWRDTPTIKIKDLIDNSHKKYQNYQVMAAKDPTDLILIGNELKTCVNLSGRVERVTGLLGYLRDGRTHQILVKSSPTSPSVASSRLQIFWDDKNNKPVLYLDEVIFLGQNTESYDLEKSIYAYAKKYAADLRLDLVSTWVNKDPSVTYLGGGYRGTVKCLGSSSPIEYINFYHENHTKPFTITGACVLSDV